MVTCDNFIARHRDYIGLMSDSKKWTLVRLNLKFRANKWLGPLGKLI
jgi:hypothetical protein